MQGTGILTLFRVTYDEARKPVETSVQRWPLNTNEEGRAELKIKAAAPGQYRLAYQVTDAKEQTIEGGYVLTIIGEGFDGTAYRFQDLELIPDRADYQPGDKVRLQINTDRADSTVLLFVKPANGVYLPPRLIRLDGKSTVTEIDVAKKDMPNFFIEALTIADGNVHNEIKEIVVPPEKRVLNVSVVPSADTFKPGEKGRVRLQLTDFDGRPFAGSTVVSMYDKSVEYVSGGSNVPEIREFFWKWRRSHQLNQETSLNRNSHNMTLPGKPSMNSIGVFGHTVADESAVAKRADGRAMGMGGFGGGRAALRGMARGGGMVPEAPMMMMEMAAPAAVPCRSRRPNGLRQCRYGDAERRWRPTEPRNADGPDPIRRYRALDRDAQHRRKRRGGSADRDAGKPDDLESEGLGDGTRHARRLGRSRGRDAQEPDRPVTGAAIPGAKG